MLKFLSWLPGLGFGGFGKIFTGLLVLGLLGAVGYGFWDWFYVKPENWNKHAQAYKTHYETSDRTIASLLDDKQELTLTVGKRDSVITKKDSVIHNLSGVVDTLQKEAKKSVELGQQYQSMWQAAVKDARGKADALTQTQRDAAWYQTLLSSGELSPLLPVSTLNLGSAPVVNAGLKISIKADEGEKALTTASTAIGRLTSANSRMSAGMQHVSKSLGETQKKAADGLTGTPVFRAPKTRRTLKTVEAELDSAKRALEQMMQLENALNPK